MEEGLREMWARGTVLEVKLQEIRVPLSVVPRPPQGAMASEGTPLTPSERV